MIKVIKQIVGESMEKLLIVIATQISLILASSIFAISLISDAKDGKRYSYYAVSTAIILLGASQLLHSRLTYSAQGLIIIGSICLLSIWDIKFVKEGMHKWVYITGFVLGLLLCAFSQPISILIANYKIAFGFIVIIISFVYFISNIKRIKALEIVYFFSPTLAAISFEFLSSYSYVGYFFIMLYFSATNVLLYQENINDKKLMAERLHILEKDFENELEKGVKKRTFYVERLKDRMAEVNKIDHLTKALNRKAITNAVDDLIDSSSVKQFVLLIFDIDKFKNINDTYGHVTGDVCLKTLSAIALKNIRDVDLLGRYGGDEFIILLPNLSLKDGLAVADRFRSKVAETQNPHFSISIGAAAYPWDGETLKEILSTADRGLYVSKEHGRNKVSYDGYIKLDGPFRN